jgi:hypothetical protein
MKPSGVLTRPRGKSRLRIKHAGPSECSVFAGGSKKLRPGQIRRLSVGPFGAEMAVFAHDTYFGVPFALIA